MERECTVGDIVIAEVRTGEYIAEVVEVADRKALIKMLAVRKHPMQGDLHNKYEVDVTLFHQRRALAQWEKVYVPVRSLELYVGEVPAYKESLKQAVEAEIAALENAIQTGGMNEKLIKWAERSLEQYRDLEKDYFPAG